VTVPGPWPPVAPMVLPVSAEPPDARKAGERPDLTNAGKWLPTGAFIVC
jgi:hypothetical protein